MDTKRILKYGLLIGLAFTSLYTGALGAWLVPLYLHWEPVPSFFVFAAIGSPITILVLWYFWEYDSFQKHFTARPKPSKTEQVNNNTPPQGEWRK